MAGFPNAKSWVQLSRARGTAGRKVSSRERRGLNHLPYGTDAAPQTSMQRPRQTRARHVVARGLASLVCVIVVAARVACAQAAAGEAQGRRVSDASPRPPETAGADPQATTADAEKPREHEPRRGALAVAAALA
jgi:hypothetical protein